ncbi:hypothetical protein CMI37_22460 [Candidatus Pacearchaeota archaeon]|nr:hypothetical protein [Candidatus Pacearchaeota archaeon]|tara:strand:+ start:2549 stop:2812 length:264 start_codon:yes stop_codon:yes gene_type:complete
MAHNIPANTRNLSYTPPKQNPETDQEPQIGTVDNGHEYIGQGRWRGTEHPCNTYDSNGNLVSQKRDSILNRAAYRITESFLKLTGAS